jgi:hypothetical protein
VWNELRLPGALWYLAVAAFVTSGVGILSANAYVLPALDVLAVLPVFVWARSRSTFQGTALALLLWAGCKVAAVAFFTVQFPGRAAEAVAFGPAYADGMRMWLSSGEDVLNVGAWGTLRLKEAGILAASSLATGGLGGLACGAVLVNCQAYYFGTLIGRSVDPVRVLIFGWPLWEVFRALGFVNVLLAGAEPLGSRVLGKPVRARELRDGLIIAVLMLAAAYVAQISFAAWWRDMLAPALLFE